jgi:hypothetical protein
LVGEISGKYAAGFRVSLTDIWIVETFFEWDTADDIFIRNCEGQWVIL